MRKLNFIKMHGIGNDFAIFDMRKSPSNLTTSTIKILSHRQLGIGCDQLILLKSSNTADCEMEIYNQDGSKSSACGNATRCVSMLIGKKNSTIKIGSKLLKTQYFNDKKISVNMVQITKAPTKMKFKNIEGYATDVGNPHLVFFVEDFNFNLQEIGSYFENHKKFPNKINVNFAKVLNDKTIELKVWERGTGATLACGTGACATQYVANYFELTKPKATVKQAGGNLEIEIKNNEIIMTGSATKVFDGVIEV